MSKYIYEVGDKVDWYGEICTIIGVAPDVLKLERQNGERVLIRNPGASLPIIQNKG